MGKLETGTPAKKNGTSQKSSSKRIPTLSITLDKTGILTHPKSLIPELSCKLRLKPQLLMVTLTLLGCNLVWYMHAESTQHNSKAFSSRTNSFPDFGELTILIGLVLLSVMLKLHGSVV